MIIMSSIIQQWEKFFWPYFFLKLLYCQFILPNIIHNSSHNIMSLYNCGAFFLHNCLSLYFYIDYEILKCLVKETCFIIVYIHVFMQRILSFHMRVCLWVWVWVWVRVHICACVKCIGKHSHWCRVDLHFASHFSIWDKKFLP